MSIVLRWQAVPKSHRFQFSAAGAVYEAAGVAETPTVLAAIVGPPGRDGDEIDQLDCGVF